MGAAWNGGQIAAGAVEGGGGSAEAWIAGRWFHVVVGKGGGVREGGAGTGGAGGGDGAIGKIFIVG